LRQLESHCSISGKDDMIGSTKRQLWLVILMAAGGGVTPLLAAEHANNQGMRMSFDRACKRLASDVMGAVSGAHHDQTGTVSPRASREFPLQQPPHPPEAPDQEGTVVLDIFVTEAGLVSEVRVSRSSGHQALDLAAMKITERWRLLPGTVSGEPVCMWGKFAVMFRVDEK
jgi:TonB family protein